MVQIIPRPESFTEKLMKGLNAGVKAGAELAEPYIKQRQLQKSLQELKGAYTDENSPERRMIEAYQKLSGFPDVASQLGGQLSRFAAQEKQAKWKKLLGEEEESRTAQSLQNIQDLYADPNLSEEEKIFGAYQELAQNPSLAKNVIGSLETTSKKQGKDVAGKQFSTGYNAILEGDTETLKQVLDDPKTPLETKLKLTTLHDRFETHKGVEARELRNRQSFVARSYDRAIANEQRNLTTAPYSKRSASEKKIKQLEAFKRGDLSALVKKPKAYPNLKLWNYIDPEFLNEEEESEFEDMLPMELPQERVKFNSKNPKHVARAKEVLASVGGDRARANAMLAEEFTK